MEEMDSQVLALRQQYFQIIVVIIQRQEEVEEMELLGAVILQELP